MGLTALEHVRTEQATFEPTEDELDGEIVPFGIYHVDSRFIMGVKPLSPQLNVIQGGRTAMTVTAGETNKHEKLRGHYRRS